MSFQADPISVSQLVGLLKDVTEENFARVLVEGEIANFSAPASGHWYFTLKDSRSQIQAVMFRPQNRLVRFTPETGLKVLAGGRVSVYSQRGSLQLICEQLDPCGQGSLQLALEQLKEKLGAEGLFAAERKRDLPTFPRTVGIVTSATGAAIHDILTVLRKRSAGLRVILRPALVQGEGAAADIAAAIEALNRHGEADVLIVGRGGGSLEDLWAFNEESVVRAIAASAIPVISAVGHEVDTTLADYAADLRAPTPSAAAETVVKSRLELESHVDHLVQRLSRPMQSRLQRCEDRLLALQARLRSPRQQVQRMQDILEGNWLRLKRCGDLLTREADYRLARVAEHLDSLSPLKTLSRGYAIAFHDGKAVIQAKKLQPGDDLRIRLHRGEVQATVKKVDS